MRRANSAAAIGTMLEFYDFIIYGLAATLVFGKIFFPADSSLVSTLQALGTFAVGFLFRPIGGIVLGRIGDRIGRKKVLILTLVLMGGATTLIGLLPTQGQIGISAPILLVVLRILQGIGASAELGGATIVAVEFASEEKRGLAGSLPGVGNWSGSVLATGIMALMALLPEDQFLSWGWRVPFLLSLALVAFGLWLRTGLPETPEFERIQDPDGKARTSLRALFTEHYGAVLCVLAVAYATAAIAFYYQVFALSFARGVLELDATAALVGTLAGSIAALITTPLFGKLSDRVGRRPVLIFGLAFSAIFAFGYFWIVSPGSPWQFWLAMMFAVGIGNGALFATGGTFFVELFPIGRRFTAFGFSRELANAIGGGLTPLIAVQLLAVSGGGTLWLSVYVAGVSLIALVAVLCTRETFRASPDRLDDSGGGAPPTPTGKAVAE